MTASLPFANRAQAGAALAERLLAMHLPGPTVVLALPRGGVPIAAVVALALGAPLGLLLVRKIGAPGQPELAVAAVVEGSPPQIVVDEAVQEAVGADAQYIRAQAGHELTEIARRREAYLKARPTVEVKGRTVIVVDDGIATGATMRAALKAIRTRSPSRLVLAVPVAPADTLGALRSEADQIVCLAQPFPFHAVGDFYIDFHQVADEEVIAALDAAAAKE